MEPNHKFAQDSEIGSVVEPMVWVYIEDIDRFEKLWCISFHSAKHQALNQHHQCKPSNKRQRAKKIKHTCAIHCGSPTLFSSCELQGIRTLFSCFSCHCQPTLIYHTECHVLVQVRGQLGMENVRPGKSPFFFTRFSWDWWHTLVYTVFFFICLHSP